MKVGYVIGGLPFGGVGFGNDLARHLERTPSGFQYVVVNVSGAGRNRPNSEAGLRPERERLQGRLEDAPAGHGPGPAPVAAKGAAGHRPHPTSRRVLRPAGRPGPGRSRRSRTCNVKREGKVSRRLINKLLSFATDAICPCPGLAEPRGPRPQPGRTAVGRTVQRS